MVLLRILASAFIPSASAQAPNVDAVINFIAGPIGGMGGIPNEFGGIAQFVAQSFLPFMNVIAVLTIVISGTLSVVSQDENRISATRKVVAGALTAIVLVNLASAIAKALFDEFNYLNGATPGNGSQYLVDEIFGLLSWIEQPVMILALLTIVISGIRTLISFGGEKGLNELRSTIISVIFGIVLIVVKVVVSKAVVFDRTAIALNQIGINLTITVLLYMGLIAVIMIVIAGIYMIVNVGNDEQYTRAKNLLIRVITGLFVIVVAGTLALFIASTFVAP